MVMLPIRVSLAASEVDAWLQRLDEALDAQVRVALELTCGAVAEEARASHPYQNRSGDLEAMTQPGGIAGSFYDDTLIGDVTAGMPYASYVEERGFEFLMPAWERSAGQIDRILADSIQRAVSLIG
jgi:hypothetical protein